MGTQQPPQKPNLEPDALFLAKLVGVSVGGAAAIKYGSLLTDIPFDPNAALALFLVAAPPVVYALILTRRSVS